MILFIIVSLFSGQVLGNPIAGGDISFILWNPWIASIQLGGYHHCVGSIISETLVLTAAHCTDKYSPESFIIRAGSTRTDSEGRWYRVVAIKQHEKYEELDHSPEILNDLALMKVSSPFMFTSVMSTIRLAKKGHTIEQGTILNIAGWGSTFDGGPLIEHLRGASMRVVNSSDCANTYRDQVGYKVSMNNQFCTTPSSGEACMGDFGGPLVDENLIQVGIMSWGYDCTHFHHPQVHQNVAHYRDWIDANSHILDPSADLEKSKHSRVSEKSNKSVITNFVGYLRSLG